MQCILVLFLYASAWVWNTSNSVGKAWTQRSSIKNCCRVDGLPVRHSWLNAAVVTAAKGGGKQLSLHEL